MIPCYNHRSCEESCPSIPLSVRHAEHKNMILQCSAEEMIDDLLESPQWCIVLDLGNGVQRKSALLRADSLFRISVLHGVEHR